MFKVLVCGSREFRDKEFLFKTLDFLLSRKDLKDVALIHGAQKSFDKYLEVCYGADYFAGLWAKERGVKVEEFPAPWDGLPDTPKSQMRKNKTGRLYFPGAGPYRNRQLLNQNPDACVGFLVHGAKNVGTRGMLKLSQDKGILTKKYYI